MSSFLADECVRSRPNEFEPHHFQLSKLCDCAALKISPMPSAWVAVIGTTGYVFRPDSDGSWFYVLAVAAQHKLAHLSEDNYLEPTITFVPLDQDEMAGVTKFAYNVADLPPQTRAYIEEEPKILVLSMPPKARACLEKDPGWKELFSRLEPMSSLSALTGHNVFKIKEEETSPQE